LKSRLDILKTLEKTTKVAPPARSVNRALDRIKFSNHSND